MYKVDLAKVDTIKATLKNTCLVVASKYIDAGELKLLADDGVNNFGENRIDALLSKKALCSFPAVWHFIGHLQSRKVKEVINEIDYLHSLDHLSIAKEIQKYSQKTIDCFIEVNVAKEASKSGIYAEDLGNFIEQLANYDKIRIVGLMTMAPNTDDKELIESVFSQLQDIQKRIISLNLKYAPCMYLSMGMSNDYLLAMKHGATHVRLGRILLEGEA